jgi:hypothetical protein
MSAVTAPLEAISCRLMTLTTPAEMLARYGETLEAEASADNTNSAVVRKYTDATMPRRHLGTQLGSRARQSHTRAGKRHRDMGRRH